MITCRSIDPYLNFTEAAIYTFDVALLLHK